MNTKSKINIEMEYTRVLIDNIFRLKKDISELEEEIDRLSSVEQSVKVVLNS